MGEAANISPLYGLGNRLRDAIICTADEIRRGTPVTETDFESPAEMS